MVRVGLRVVVVALMFTGLMTMISSQVAAQDGIEGSLQQLPGLETAYARKYLADRTIGFVTPVTSTTMTPSVMTVTVLEFDTEASATTAFDLALTDRLAGMVLGVEDTRLTSSDLADLGDRARLFEAELSPADGHKEEYASLLAVQDGDLGFLITASGTSASLTETLPDVAAYMVETQPGGDVVTVSDNGVLTGGTADLLPDASDDVLPAGLIPMYDYDLLVSNSPVEAAATPTS